MVDIKLNNKWYRTDKETARLFHQIVPEAIETHDFSAAWCMLDLGLMGGRITEIVECEPFTIQVQAFRDAIR